MTQQYNVEALNKAMEMDAPLFKTKKCAQCETFDDIVAFVDPKSPHAVNAMRHYCALPLTPSASKLMDEALCE
jgi:hypothetical protein